MNDIEILKEMLISGVQIPLQHEPGRPSVELPDEQGNTVKIKGLPYDSIVIRAEDFKFPLTIFQNSKHERRRADFVIVSNEDTKKWIICIETKEGKIKGQMIAHVKDQLKGAQCFMSYCKCIGRSFWKKKEFLKNYEYRFVSMSYIKDTRRSRSERRRAPLHNHPDKFLKIFGNYHYFTKLIHKAS